MNKKNVSLLLLGIIVLFLGFKLKTNKLDLLMWALKFSGLILVIIATLFAMKSLKDSK